jgi:hypothetical protein
MKFGAAEIGKAFTVKPTVKTLAEAITLGSITNLVEGDNKPYIAERGIKKPLTKNIVNVR